ncbi:hypothetical protein BN2476_110237 [Paraburkholderia piptadeniae]|uniref:Uncharacterized protein n=1 Tax=Paraburkholderia piptadeniae TaxID=1701573 RepID=A0A1N7RRM6_9BURK|nr:hypothetical protein BN2476_110237 [Paraburkholderia piptadeniae]
MLLVLPDAKARRGAAGWLTTGSQRIAGLAIRARPQRRACESRLAIRRAIAAATIRELPDLFPSLNSVLTGNRLTRRCPITDHPM